MPIKVLPDKIIDQALRNLGNYRVLAAQHIAAEGPSDEFSGALLLSLGLRESLLQNINNPAGTDRGWAQITDLWHKDWLASEPGCPQGSWRAVEGKTALDEGYCPRFTPAALYAVQMLRDAAATARKEKVPSEKVVHFSVAAYNAGQSGAMRGYRENNIDKYTTGGDYSEWVITHRRYVLKWLREHPNWQL